MGGYTPAARFVVRLEGNTSVFVKAATDEQTAGWLRAERRVYAALVGDFLPALRAWNDDGAHPILLLEDLSHAHWPPPWTTAQIDAVLGTLARVRALAPSAPLGLPRLADQRADFDGWRRVQTDSAPFLSLGLCSRPWLDHALPDLVAAEEAVALDGTDLLHLDVRSDNLCFVGERTVLVDWNWACVGNGLMDIAGWLPSLHAESGPPPEAILPGQPALAAALSGFWAFRAGLSPPPKAPRVRLIQRVQLSAALPWAARTLGLPPPG